MIAAIYETVVNPSQFDSFLDVFAEHIEQAIHAPIAEPGDALAHLDQAIDVDSPGRDSELQAHFARASQILEQVGRRIPMPSVQDRVLASRTPMLAFAPDGTIAARNAACTGWLAELGKASDLTPGLLAHSEQLFLLLLRDLRSGSGTAQGPVVLSTGQYPRHLVARITASSDPKDLSQYLLLEPLDFQWSQQAGEMLVRSFSLSPAEVEIVRQLMTGKSLRDIAGDTGKSEHTVRNQTKSVLSKVGAPGQVELIRLVAYLISDDNRTGVQDTGDGLKEESFVARDGRKVQLFRTGATSGETPVIFLHGMLDALAVLSFLTPRLYARNYDVFAPMRPGFGLSDPVLRPEIMLDVVAEQVEDLMFREDIERPVIVGHMAGGTYAHVIAHKLHDKISGVVAIDSGAPIQRLSDITSMPKRVRALAYAAKFTPGLLPMLLRAGIAMIDSDNVETFVQSHFPPGTADHRVIEKLGLGPWLQKGYRMSVRQGAAGFASDSYWMVRDWSGVLTGPSAPVIYLHGEDDQVNKIDRIQPAIKKMKNVIFRPVPDVGQLVFFERPELVFSAIDELRGSG